MLVLEVREKTAVPGEKPLGAKDTTINKLNLHMTSTPGFEHKSNWWEASVLTTAPLFLLSIIYDKVLYSGALAREARAAEHHG